MKLLDVINSPWAITESKLGEIVSIYRAHVRGPKIDLTALEGTGVVLNNQQDLTFQTLGPNNEVALIEIDGVIGKRMNLFTKISGGASTELIGNQVMAAVNDDSIKAILLRIDSPGGTVQGTKELADLIFSVRGQKPIVTFVDGSMMSAALWIGLASDVVILSSEVAAVGSMGVIATHIDMTKAEEMAGIKTTHIVTGKFKSLGSSSEELSDDGRDEIQRQIDAVFEVFVGDVARFRGVGNEAALNALGDAQILIGREAVDSGFVDSVSTLDEVVSSLIGIDTLGLFAPMEEETIELEEITVDDGHNNNDEEGASVMKINKKEESVVTADELAEQIEKANAEGRDAGLDEGSKVGARTGAKAESDRIKGVLAHVMKGHEELVNRLAFDGKTTPDQAASAVVGAEQERLRILGEKLQRESTSVPDAETPNDDTSKANTDLPIDEQIEANWTANAELRNEFSSKETYGAWLKADQAGLIKTA